MAIKVNGTTVINDSRALTNVASVDATTAASITAAGVGGAFDVSGGVGSSGMQITATSIPPIGCLILCHSGDTRVAGIKVRELNYGIQFTASNSTNVVRLTTANAANNDIATYMIETGTWRVLNATYKSSDGNLICQRIA
jgi:hypothetical protein